MHQIGIYFAAGKKNQYPVQEMLWKNPPPHLDQDPPDGSHPFPRSRIVEQWSKPCSSHRREIDSKKKVCHRNLFLKKFRDASLDDQRTSLFFKFFQPFFHQKN